MVDDWDVQSGTNFEYMFYNCFNLEYLDLSSWYLYGGEAFCQYGSFNGVCAEGMFRCSGLKKFKIGSCANLVCAKYMFADCLALEEVSFGLGNFSDNIPVARIDSAFSMCESLRHLDLTGLYATNSTSMVEIIYGCNNLIQMDLGERWVFNCGVPYGFPDDYWYNGATYEILSPYELLRHYDGSQNNMAGPWYRRSDL